MGKKLAKVQAFSFFCAQLGHSWSKGCTYVSTIYNIISKNKGAKVKAPDSYSWMVNIDIPGSYYKNGQYDFLDEKGNSVKQFDIYSLVNAFPAETPAGYPDVLIYDVSEDQW
ncbi:hypothetical protein [Paenibacillus sp.]|uniref:hypothetical protein n=1 Tax=Paenibacillus sp. TaxID=58172 RepID=UPI002823D34A|nr:hypothetical protein [Paenibacillus sp.]MDR0267116.1 hypothetical protein [Paenibacillus sp.]